MPRSGPKSPIRSLCACLAMVCLWLPTQVEAEWLKSFAEARRVAASTGKPILVDFYAEWCGPCKAMERDAFDAASVKQLLKRAVCVRLNVDTRPPEAKRFGVNSIPRVILLSSDATSVLMDLEGYRDAETFGGEFSQAIGAKTAASGVSEPSAAATVRQALESGAYRGLAKRDPGTAKAGLRILVQQLGGFDEKQFQAASSVVAKAGEDALPALLVGMGDKMLAVRVASHRVLKVLLGDRVSHAPAYDPWAGSAVRKSQLDRVRRWLRATHLA